MTPEDLAFATPGQPIRLGRYEVTGLIRAGGMGTVFDARDVEHGTRVALKTLNHLDARGLFRFKNEFRAVADLAHPNLVSLYELSSHEDLWFFTMERIAGGDLLRGLRAAPPHLEQSTVKDGATGAPTPEALRPPPQSSRGVRPATASLPRSIDAVRAAFAQLAKGVAALHASGLLHLDLKPSNVLMEATGRVVVVDFGLIRELGAAPSALGEGDRVTISGTPGWMAPEQYSGEGLGPATDWYAVGLLLYLTLTGVPAFPPASPGAASYAQLHVPPIPPHELLEGVPVDLSELAMALLHPEPDHRPLGPWGTPARLSPLRAPDAPDAPDALAALVGRDAELRVLRAALASARTGACAVLHVSSPSGFGKSAILRAVLADAEDAGALVLRARCYERESVPYKAFDGMLDDLAVWLLAHGGAPGPLPTSIVELARVFPVLLSVPAIAAHVASAGTSGLPLPERRRRAVSALRELLGALAAERPLVLAIDDLHWADADSAALLVSLLAEPAPRGLSVVATYRPVEAARNVALEPYRALLDRARGRADLALTFVSLGPLSEASATELATSRLGRAATFELASSIARESGGVPFFVEELAQYAARRPDDVSAGGLDLARVLASRVASLEAAERSLVEAIAVADSPVPVGVAFAVAGTGAGALRALWSLGATSFVRSTGAGADDRVELGHDRLREAVLAATPPERVEALHLALGWALSTDGDADATGSRLFDAVRHLACVPHLLAPEQRRRVASLELAAGLRARQSAAFPLAFDCFHRGAELLPGDAWDTDYALALALHGGAAEAACLSGLWADQRQHVQAVKAHGKTTLDQLVAWEAEIDACIARTSYVEAVDAAIDVLQLLGSPLPAHPGEAEVGAELQAAMAVLASKGPDGVLAQPAASDPVVAATMRIQSRVASAAYFSRPMLLPVLACRLVVASATHGLSPATPYALSVFGIVLNSLGLLREAHTWGQVALALIDRFEDRSLEARTRHVVHDLVCTWIVPLRGTLADLRRVVDIGRESGDLEYAGYAAHAYVHNAFYAAAPLPGLLREALVLGESIRAWDQQNALHVHVPFEQALRCLTGGTRDPARLDGDGFDEQAALAEAARSGSRSAQCIVRLLMGFVRYHAGEIEAASRCFEEARPFLDGVVSTWHVPMLHQYAALAIHRLPRDQRAELLPAAEASLVALRALAEAGPANFAHRVELVTGEAALADGTPEAALAHAERAIEGATAGAWLADLALAHELASRCCAAMERGGDGERHDAEARTARARWGQSTSPAAG